MLRYPVQILTALAFISPVITSWTPPPKTTPASSPAATLHQDGTILRPIHPADLEASSGIERRIGLRNVNGLKPVNQSQFVWGANTDDDTLFLANLTLHAPDGLPIVSLERFDHLIGDITCKDIDDLITMTFASTQAFEKAEMEWKFVNENDEGRFLFITDGLKDGCGSEGQRTPFVISNVTNDRVTLTTSLAARAVNWTDVAGSYEMDFGHKVPSSQGHPLKRGLLDGSYNRNSNSNVNISAGTPGLRKNIYTDHDAGLSLDCTNCFIAGSFLVQSHVEVKKFKLQDLVLKASPQSFSAALELEATITATDSPQALSFNHSVVPYLPIPDAGFQIDEIVSVGASLSYSVGGSCTFSGDAIVDFGINATVPDTAQIVADFYGKAASSVTGFDANDLRPSFHIANDSATISLSAYSQPELTFGFTLHEVAAVDVTLAVKLPELDASFKAESDANGACNSSTSGIKTEILVEPSAGMEIEIDFDAGWHKEDAKTPLWSAQLYSTSIPLPSACYPLDLPHLAPSPSTTVAPSLPASRSMSAAFSGETAFQPSSLGFGGSSSSAGLGSGSSLQGGSSGERSTVEMTSIPKPTYSMTSLSVNSSTTVSPIASGSPDTGSTSTFTTFSTSVTVGESSSRPSSSSSTSQDYETTSLTASGISTIVSNTRSSSTTVSLPTSMDTASIDTTFSTSSTVKIPLSSSSSALEISSRTASSISSSPIVTDSTSRSYFTASSSLETTSSMASPTSELSSAPSSPIAGISSTTSTPSTSVASSAPDSSSASLSTSSSTPSTPDPSLEYTSSPSSLSQFVTTQSNSDSMSLPATSSTTSKPSPPSGSTQGTSPSSKSTSSDSSSSSSRPTSASPSGTVSGELSTFSAVSSTTSSFFGTATSSLSSEISISPNSPSNTHSTVPSSSPSSETTVPFSGTSSLYQTSQSSTLSSKTFASSSTVSSTVSTSSLTSQSLTILPTTSQVSSPTTTAGTASSRSQSSNRLSISVSVASSQSNQADATSSESSTTSSATIVSLTTKSSSSSLAPQGTELGSTGSETSTIETTSGVPSVTASQSISRPSDSVEVTTASSTQTQIASSSATETTEKSTTTPIPTPPSPSPAITSPSAPTNPTPTVTPKETTQTPSLRQATHESKVSATSLCKRGHKVAAPTPVVQNNVGGHGSGGGKSQHATASAGCDDDA